MIWRLDNVIWRLINRIRGRDYFVTVDPGGTFIPSAVVVGYTDRKGEIHIERVFTV